MLLNFDYDGVIADSSSELLEIVGKAQSSLGQGRPPRISDCNEMGDHTFENWGRYLGIASNDLQGFVAIIHQLQSESKVVPCLYPDMANVIRKLSKKNTITIVSATASQKIATVLNQNGLANCVGLILGGESNLSKAERLIFALERFAFSRAESFIIGDACSDIRAGKLVGIKTVAATWGFEAIDRLREARPDIILNNPTELLSIFEE